MSNTKSTRRRKIKARVAGQITSSVERPRLVVFRSNSEIYAQIVEHGTGRTICTVSSLEKDIQTAKENKSAKATVVGKRIAEKAKALGVSTVVFDRNGFLYHGRVKNLAEGAREGGLIF
jgi:large subunit ribosomal protein L18